MEDIIKLINYNTNIPFELKNKFIECTNIILKNFDCAYRNLNINLENIKVCYLDDSNRYVIRNIKAVSLYDPINNIIYLDPAIANGPQYKNLIIHELLHVASNKNNDLGLETLYGHYSKSLNEGFTELLTRKLCGDLNFGVNEYENDINNISIFIQLLGYEEIEKNYFNGKIYNIIVKYFNLIGDNNNLSKILVNMERDHEERLIHKRFNNMYKDIYIKDLVNDISKIKFKDEKKVISIITFITSFIRGQYKSKKIPGSIKIEIEESLNIMINKEIGYVK